MLLIHYRIDPILIATVFIDNNVEMGQDIKVKSFLFKLTNGKNPAEYYARHVKNLAFFGAFLESEIDIILSICTGVENFALRTRPDLPVSTHLSFLENPEAGMPLRRLCLDYWQCGGNKYHGPDSFHPCFRNLTHLHLIDTYKHLTYYTGWEHLTNLTHLALASCDTGTLQKVMNLLPAIRFVALCNSYRGDQYGYINVVVHDTPDLDPRVVLLSNLPPSDWECGARGKRNFWNAVEDEVERRRREGRANSTSIPI